MVLDRLNAVDVVKRMGYVEVDKMFASCAQHVRYCWRSLVDKEVRELRRALTDVVVVVAIAVAIAVTVVVLLLLLDVCCAAAGCSLHRLSLYQLRTVTLCRFRSLPST